MSTTTTRPTGVHPPHGSIAYLQLPAVDIAGSAAFYGAVVGWSVELTYASFEGPGIIGQFTTELAPSGGDGPVVWLCVEQLYPALRRVVEHGGAVRGRPSLDQGARWLVEVDDPAGNHVGLVAQVVAPRPQTLLAVRDVEASSRWYQRVLGLRSDHGGPDYERLLADGELVLQLHRWDVEHHHGPIPAADGPVGNGVLVWFGEVSDFDGVVERVAQLDAPVVRPPHRNPPEGRGNGPGHREIWVTDPDGYTLVVASPDGESFEP